MKNTYKPIQAILKRMALVLPLALLVGCRTTSSEITADWSQEDVEKEAYEHVMVAALTDTANFQPRVEKELAFALAEYEVPTMLSLNVLPRVSAGPENESEKAAALEEAKEEGVDAILTVSIIDEHINSRYVHGNTYYNPTPVYGYYSNLWGYYNHMDAVVHTPGYYTQSEHYFVETNLYDAETEELMWSAQSKAYDPATMKTFTEDYAKVITEHLAEEGWITSIN